MCKSSLYEEVHFHTLKQFKTFVHNEEKSLLYKQSVSLPTAIVNSKTQNQDDTRTRQSKSPLFVSKKLCHPFLQLIMLVCKFPCRYKPVTVFIFFIKYVFNQSIMLGVINHCYAFQILSSSKFSPIRQKVRMNIFRLMKELITAAEQRDAMFRMVVLDDRYLPSSATASVILV